MLLDRMVVNSNYCHFRVSHTKLCDMRHSRPIRGNCPALPELSDKIKLTTALCIGSLWYGYIHKHVEAIKQNDECIY